MPKGCEKVKNWTKKMNKFNIYGRTLSEKAQERMS